MGQAGYLVLKDGAVFTGELLGGTDETYGEVVFNTAMSGYEEVLTDPSYHRQIVVMTQPEIGNYGITLEDEESFGGPKVSGFVMREYNTPSNHRAKLDLKDYLEHYHIAALMGVDTRKLVLHIREKGAMSGLIASAKSNKDKLKAEAAALTEMNGQHLVAQVSTEQPYQVGQNTSSHHVVLVDYGAKRNIASLLAMRDCRVTVVPCLYTAEQILALKPNGVLLSNGPGDPASMSDIISNIRMLIGEVPIFGICLGHQLLGLALGAKTFKLKFGHRGCNQPVQDIHTKRILITSQNHGFCVDPATLPASAQVTHLNLSDHTLEGFAVPSSRLFAVQFHPEASPGPHESAPLFDDFVQLMTNA